MFASCSRLRTNRLIAGRLALSLDSSNYSPGNIRGYIGGFYAKASGFIV